MWMLVLLMLIILSFCWKWILTPQIYIKIWLEWGTLSNTLCASNWIFLWTSSELGYLLKTLYKLVFCSTHVINFELFNLTYFDQIVDTFSISFFDRWKVWKSSWRFKLEVMPISSVLTFGTSRLISHLNSIYALTFKQPFISWY